MTKGRSDVGCRYRPAGLAALLLLVVPWSSASASEIVAGIYAHGRDFELSPFQTVGGFEGGEQIALGYRTDRLSGLRAIGSPTILGMVSVNTEGGTNFATAGLEWRVNLSRDFYLAPGLGVAVHDGVVKEFQGPDDELNLGSRVLFAPSVAIGWSISERIAIEASYIHLSHGGIARKQNPGLDEVGLRLVYRFGKR